MKKAIFGFVALVFLGGMGKTARASGFTCQSEDSRDGYNVRLFNHVNPDSGTRTPAVLVVSQAQRGTLLTRKNAAIRKHIRERSVQYVVEGSRKLDADLAILQIAFREGREVLEEGASVAGQLILIKDNERRVSELTCIRYLKQ